MQNGLYVAEYSYKQGSFHIETLEQAAKTNRQIMYDANEDWNDYVIFAYGTQEECYRELKRMMIYKGELEENQGYIDCQGDLEDE